MMTVMFRGRKPRRFLDRPLEEMDLYPWAPPTWGGTSLDRKPWPATSEPGSAKPGRGGRRKRKADRAKIRARIGAGVERKGWPLSWALRKWTIIKGPARPWTDAEIAALAQGPWFVLPAGCELQILEPKILGRRERRRRAKLRRRRARTEERRAARRTAEMTRALLKAGVRPLPVDIPTARYPMTSSLAARIFAKVERCATEEATKLLIGSSAKTRTPGA